MFRGDMFGIGRIVYSPFLGKSHGMGGAIEMVVPGNGAGGEGGRGDGGEVQADGRGFGASTAGGGGRALFHQSISILSSSESFLSEPIGRGACRWVVM